jgi:hypothetical protein
LNQLILGFSNLGNIWLVLLINAGFNLGILEFEVFHKLFYVLDQFVHLGDLALDGRDLFRKDLTSLKNCVYGLYTLTVGAPGFYPFQSVDLAGVLDDFHLELSQLSRVNFSFILQLLDPALEDVLGFPVVLIKVLDVENGLQLDQLLVHEVFKVTAV